MKSFLCIIFLIVPLSLFSQQKRALLVGISDYPSSSGWSKIHAGNDIGLLKKEIVRKGFSLHILENQKATKDGIVGALEKLCDKVHGKDTVLIHFSCHGQQVFCADERGNRQLREALIPYDAKLYYQKNIYEGEHHLLDYELGTLLSEIRRKIGPDGVLFINIDACHSGDAVRAMTGEAPVRGTNSVFTDDPFYTRPNKKEVIKNKVLSRGDDKFSSFCAVYACQSFQNNYELKVDGIYYGALSYAFYQTLK
ncbi:MAG: caspase family protein, partial [Lachnospiraceae bacterium]|nr:caspase family protein [Lachnospiraceae bacterium]